MADKSAKSFSLLPGKIKLLLLIVLVLSVVFRFSNLNQKVIWGDETYTALRVSGYQWSEYSQILDGREITVEEVQKYQTVNKSKGFRDTLKSLEVEDPHHPPLYYLILRFFQELLGSSLFVRRGVSVVISLLALPCSYWLCLELFESSIIACFAVIIMATSPFHLLYGQEIREYGLWTVATIFSSAALLRSIRLNRKFDWAIYSISVVISLYTFLFSVFVLLGHGIYVLILRLSSSSKHIKAYLISLFLGVLAYTPWLIIVVANYSTIVSANSNQNKKLPLLELIKNWLANLTRSFADFHYGYSDPFNLTLNYQNQFTYLFPIYFLLTAYAVYFLVRTTPVKTWSFILTLGGIIGGYLIFSDVIKETRTSIWARYFTPSILAIQIAVAYLLARKITLPAKPPIRKFWLLLTSAIISLSVISCFLSANSPTAWIKHGDYYNPPVVNIVNSSANPLFIIDNPWRVAALSYLLNPEVTMQVFYHFDKEDKSIPTIDLDRFSDIFVLTSYDDRSDVFVEKLDQQIRGRLAVIYEGKISRSDRVMRLWKLS